MEKETYNIPEKLKRKIILNNLKTIVFGTFLMILFLYFRFFALNQIIEDQTELFSAILYVGISIIGIFLIIYPLILLILQTDYKKIAKEMKDCRINVRDLDFDFQNAKAFGKIKCGELCTYYSNLYHYYAIPNKHILWVYETQKVRKLKKVVKYKSGAIEREEYQITSRTLYYATLKTLDKRTINVPCNKEKTVDEIVKHYKKMGHILFDNTPENKKQYLELIKQFKENGNLEKEYQMEEENENDMASETKLNGIPTDIEEETNIEG